MMNLETAKAANETPEVGSQSLSMRDWIFIPVLIVVTSIVLVVGVEFLARKTFKTVQPRNYTMIDDPATGERAKPNSEFKIKLPEGTLSDFAFNNCGNRSTMECGPKPPGVFRVVLIGSSVPFGWYVPREQTFAATLPVKLSEMTRRPVDVYNDAMLWGTPHAVALRLNGALDVQPDVLLWVITPFEIQHSEQILPDGIPGSDEEKPAKTSTAANASQHGDSLHDLVATKQDRFNSFLEKHYRTLLVLRHYLYESETNYVKHYLMLEDSSGFLKEKPDPSWQHHLARLDFYLNGVANRAKAANVPLVVVLVPNRAQAALISARNWPNSIDPYMLGNSVKTIVEHHGATYLDILHDFGNIPNPEQLFFPVDGHPNSRGQAMISQILAKDLTQAGLPFLPPTRVSALGEGPGK